MIKIERGEPPKNTALDNRREEKLRKIEELVELGRLKSSCITELWSQKSDSRVKEFLYESQHRKCCYCERKLPKGETDVEHFRPKGEIKKTKKKHRGYWWLVYNWENLLIACRTCNRKKGTKFPLKDEKKRAYTKDSDLDQEEPFLINPLEENPEQYIYYQEIREELGEARLMVKAVGKCERGEKTVDELTGMNNKEIMLERADKLEDYEIWADLKKNGNDEWRPKADKRLRKYISRCSEFSGFAKFYFKKMECL